MGQGELTATLMRLSDLGVVKIERVKAVGEGARGVRNAADYRIRLSRSRLQGRGLVAAGTSWTIALRRPVSSPATLSM